MSNSDRSHLLQLYKEIAPAKEISTARQIRVSVLIDIDNFTDYFAPSTDMKALVLRKPGQADLKTTADSGDHRYGGLTVPWLALPTNGEGVIHSLASTVGTEHVQSVILLGGDAKPQFDDDLPVRVPAHAPAKNGYALRMTFEHSTLQKPDINANLPR